MTNTRNFYHDLLEQVAFIDASSRSYDQGLEIEAKRLAVTIRVLVHDTGASHSLLGQLGVKDQMQWLTTGSVDPRNLLTSNELVSMKMEMSEAGSSMSYVPHDFEYFKQFGTLVDFDTWWNQPVIKDGFNEEFSRRDLVLALANKDGGAHIDELQTRVRRLASEGSMGWLFGPAPDEGQDVTLESELVTLSPILASVRTIAEELRLTIHNNESLLTPTE